MTLFPKIKEGIDEVKSSVINGDLKRVTEILHKKRFSNVLGQTLLSLAVKNGRVAIAEYLLKNGCKILNGVPHNELAVAMWRDDVEMIDMLLRNGGDFNIFNLIPIDVLLQFGDFAKLVVAIRLGYSTEAENLIKEIKLSARLFVELLYFAEKHKRLVIVCALKSLIKE